MVIRLPGRDDVGYTILFWAVFLTWPSATIAIAYFQEWNSLASVAALITVGLLMFAGFLRIGQPVHGGRKLSRLEKAPYFVFALPILIVPLGIKFVFNEVIDGLIRLKKRHQH